MAPATDRRATLLRAAAGLFAQRPYGEVSMAQVARAAGVSKALLYQHFPSKLALFAEAFSGPARALRADVALDPGKDVGEAVLDSLDAYLRWVAANPAAYRSLLQGAAGDGALRAVVEQARREVAGELLERLAASTGRPTTPATAVAVAGWLTFVDGAVCEALDRGSEVPPPALRDLLAGALVGALQAARTAEASTTT
jgi:AcrR family transcriptional regulator